MKIHDRLFADLSATQLLGLLQLRSAVFVVEQNCIYQDIDGRDQEHGTRHIWLQSEHGAIAACLRLLKDPERLRIGRLVTAPEYRGQRCAGRLLDHVLHTSQGPWVLSAQAHLESWYATFGFEREGDNYLEDGIPHVSMARARTG